MDRSGPANPAENRKLKTHDLIGRTENRTANKYSNAIGRDGPDKLPPDGFESLDFPS
jgi:hypothetical protein